MKTFAAEIQEWFIPEAVLPGYEDRIAECNSWFLCLTLGAHQVCDPLLIYRSVDRNSEFVSLKQVKNLVCNAPKVTMERLLEIQSIVWKQ